MPKITVCIPTYNNATTLKETFESLDRQTYRDFDVVVSDDCSTDTTLAKIPANTKIVLQEKNQGLGENLNELVKYATGNILVFLAGDDILLPQALESVKVAWEKNPSIGFCVRPYYWFKDDWKIPVRKTKVKDLKPHDFIFLSGQLSGMAVKRELIKTPFENKRFVEFVSGLLPIMRSHTFAIFDEPIVAVRINSSESCLSKCYVESPILNWVEVCQKNFYDNPKLIENVIYHLSHNFIGLIQIRMYGGWNKTIKEIGKMLYYDATCMYDPKFWLYFCLICLPAGLLKRMRDFFIFKINWRLVR